MTRSRSLFTLITATLAACAIAACRAFVVARDEIVAVCSTIKRGASAVLEHGLQLAAQPQLVFRPAVMLQRSRALQTRLAKRERPEITGSWRMCPST